MSTILIADDEARIRRLVSDFLKRDGHTIVEAADGKEALNILENRRPGLDMAILDVMMPGMDGFEVLRELREQEHGETHLPVMLLTARAEDADQVRGLEGGADDYVTKPFSPIVLAARVRTLLKREGRAGAPLEQLGKLSVNELRREVMVENKPIDLTPKEYELLIYFKNNRAIALSRERHPQCCLGLRLLRRSAYRGYARQKAARQARGVRHHDRNRARLRLPL